MEELLMASQSTMLNWARLACAGAVALSLTVSPSLVPGGFGGGAVAQEGPTSVADLSERLLDSVVNISTSQTVGGDDRRVPRPNLPDGSPFQEFFDEFFDNMPDGPGRQGPRSRQVQSLGSGFVIDAKGIVITNNHVIADADEVSVNFNDGTKLEAEVIGRDTKTDIAVLRVDPGDKELTAVSFGDSNSARVGDWVLAIGNPFGLGGTVTLGIVSAIGRDINSGPYDNFIQTDAAINRGNSGGPLFNMGGEVIGINTAIISPSGGSIGIGFSIPAELATNVIDQLVEFGETRRGWLGVRIQEVTDEIAESLGMDRASGALVAGVIKGGPVDDGSIQPGDVIIEFDGKEVESMRELPRVVADSPVGKEVDVIVIRKGERQTVQVTLGRLEDGEELAMAQQDEETGDAVEAASVELFGMTIAELDDEQREAFGISDEVEDGVVITAVEPGSVAGEKAIEAGEVIVEIAQESVSTPQEVTEAIDKLKEDNRRNALLMLSSKTGELRFVTIRVD
jgi:serine protease Do